MKKFIVEFLKRGAIFAGLGPLILAIVYFFLHLNGVVEMVPVTKMIAEIISSLILAFIAAGISAVYHVEKLQLGIAGLIQGTGAVCGLHLFLPCNGLDAPSAGMSSHCLRQSLLSFSL